MLPNQTITITPDYDETMPPQKIAPSLTYRLGKQRIVGMIDGINAMKQAIWKRLMTEQGVLDIYDNTYGLQTVDLIGKDYGYVISKLQRRIKESLLHDDRITDVSNFQFRREKDYIWIGFEVTTIFGVLTSQYQFNRQTNRKEAAP